MRYIARTDSLPVFNIDLSDGAIQIRLYKYYSLCAIYSLNFDK